MSNLSNKKMESLQKHKENFCQCRNHKKHLDKSTLVWAISKVQIPEVKPLSSVCIPLRDRLSMASLLITLSLSQGWPYSHLCMRIFFLQLNYFSRKAHIQYHLLPRTTIIPFVPLRFSPVVLSQKVFPQY